MNNQTPNSANQETNAMAKKEQKKKPAPKKKNPRVLLIMKESSFTQSKEIAGSKNLKKVDTVEADPTLLKILTRKNSADKIKKAKIAIDDTVTTIPFKYILPGFMNRMGKGVPRDEAGEIIVNDGYHDNIMVEQLLQAFAERYPDITTLKSIGKTWQDRDIWALKITSDSKHDKDKPAFLFVGAHHANELLATEYVLDITQYLLKNCEKDEKVRNWVDNYSIWCLPAANPDGLYRFFHVRGSGRKNGRDTNDNGEIDERDGVDLNRNYPFRWHTLGEKASKSDPNHWWYRGPEAASEPEVKAIMKFAEQERFVMLISFHTSATKILVPYTIDNVKNPDPSVAWMVGRKMAELSDSCRKDRAYKAVRNLYSVDGTDQDWHYWKYGTLAYIWEGSKHNPPYKKELDTIVQGIRPGWGYMLDAMEEGPTISGHVLDAKTRSPLEVAITIDEITMHEGEVHTSHSKTGRFDRLMPSEGTYHLNFEKEGYKPQTIEVSVGNEWKKDITVLMQQ
jgi:hypothetical protein